MDGKGKMNGKKDNGWMDTTNFTTDFGFFSWTSFLYHLQEFRSFFFFFFSFGKGLGFKRLR